MPRWRMDPGEHSEAVAQFYVALTSGDATAVGALVTDDAFIAVPGHEGKGPAHLGSLASALSRDGFRTWAAESYDVLVSDHHAIVLDRWLVETRGLDEHITMLLADRQPDGRFGLISIYGYDGPKIGAFFE
jgi:hypothetical protein